jgi:uncharacterized protein YwbE
MITQPTLTQGGYRGVRTRSETHQHQQKVELIRSIRESTGTQGQRGVRHYRLTPLKLCTLS